MKQPRLLRVKVSEGHRRLKELGCILTASCLLHLLDLLAVGTIHMMERHYLHKKPPMISNITTSRREKDQHQTARSEFHDHLTPNGGDDGAFSEGPCQTEATP